MINVTGFIITSFEYSHQIQLGNLNFYYLKLDVQKYNQFKGRKMGFIKKGRFLTGEWSVP